MKIALASETPNNVSDPGTAARIFHKILASESELDQDKEHFWVIGLTVRNRVKFVELVHLGTLTASIVHPREVFRPAISCGCASILVGHNHPGGDPAPSREDIAITERLRDAGALLGIDLKDHVIVTNGSGCHCSMKEKGLM